MRRRLFGLRSVKSFLVTFKLWPEDGKELVWHKARGGCSRQREEHRLQDLHTCKERKRITVPAAAGSGEKGVVEMMRRGPHHHG